MIAIIKYNAGNIMSVDFALKRLGIEALITDDFDIIKNAEKVIFPGVGEASTTMSYLTKNKLDKLIISLKQPVLGICLGMQLMCSYSYEGETDCLGIFDAEVKRFEGNIKVPHIGWNSLEQIRGDLFKGINQNDYVYYVHSYYVPICDNTAAKTNYNELFSGALQKNNFYGLQFHPEKSGKIGLQILKNFIEL